ncbi:hypothetical protein ACI77M_11580 [Pseudomonas fildesensis]
MSSILAIASVAVHVVCPKGIESLPHVVSLRDWLLAESGNAQQRYR